MVVTLTLLGIILSICIAVFYLNKRRLIEISYQTRIELEPLENGVVKLLTYNVAGLPEKISSAKTKRFDSMLAIGERISSYDIVNVQEDFNYNIQLYMNNKHPYKTSHRGRALWGDGLNTFSNFPILKFKRVSWNKCNGTDCLTPKGFSLARINLAKDIIVDVYNVHATSGNSAPAAKARQRNLLQLADYICTHSVGRPLIVMGDFNARYQYHLDNMFLFLEKTKLQDSWVSTILQGYYPTVKDNFSFISDLDITNEIESIDKILFRNSPNLIFEPLTFDVVLEEFLNDKEEHLSDHLALTSTFRWKRV